VLIDIIWLRKGAIGRQTAAVINGKAVTIELT
jgi:hypothetical protein